MLFYFNYFVLRYSKGDNFSVETSINYLKTISTLNFYWKNNDLYIRNILKDDINRVVTTFQVLRIKKRLKRQILHNFRPFSKLIFINRFGFKV